MGKIDELILQYCPDGVEWKKIEEVCKVKTPPAKLKTSDYQEQGLFPIIDQGQQQYAGYTDNEKAVVEDGEYILYGDHTCIVKYHKGRFAQGADGLKILVSKANNSKYVYYAFSAYNLTSTEYKRHWTQAKEIEIPLPPLPVQEAIVNILDRFAVYAAELQAELQARQQQYNYYRDTLLSFEGRDDVQWKKLGELCPLITKQTGFDYSNYIKDKLVREKKENHIPYIQTKFFTGRQFDFNTDYYIPEETAARFPKIVLDTKCILLSIVGASIGNIGLYDNSQKSFLGGAIGVAKPSADVNTEFIYYYLTSHSGQKQIFHKVKGAGQATITIEDIREFLVPQPSLSEQQRIVDILDHFDTLVNDLSQGLPAEIEARRQQYEYYRDKLLTFKRK